MAIEAEDKRGITVEGLARDIISLSRNSLLVNFRFLDRAVSRLNPVQDGNISLATDGESIYYGPAYILTIYREDPSLVTRDLLHSIFHCVFHHNFIGEKIDRRRWDLAADISVENMINSLGSSALSVRRQHLQSALVDIIQDEIGSPLSAERIYHWLGEKGFTEDELEKERRNFIADGHGIWYGYFDKDAKTDRNLNLKKIWDEVSRRMQTELETINRNGGDLVQNLKSLNRSKHSYTDFLKRFGVQGEVLKLSEEEFDYNYYSYGMELYGNVPLIEPLEYSEQSRIREFIIAIDTSGSVKGKVVQSFIQHTHDILMRSESFFTKINMYIIQCDCVIRDVAHITSREDFKKYVDNMQILGLEQTDFRPVFSYAEQLIREKKLNKLQGLIYFTDGIGIFPEEMPRFNTAFIIHSDGCSEPDIPVWAQHMSISEEDILDRRFSAE